MKRILSIFFVFALAIAFADEGVIFKDEFNSPNQKWMVIGDAKDVFVIESGNFKSQNTSTTDCIIENNAHLYHHEDFVIKTTLTSITGKAGVVMGDVESDYYEYLLIENNKASLYEHKKNTEPILINSIDLQGVSKIDVVIRKSSHYTTFYANGMDLGKTDIDPFKKIRTGYFLGSNGSMASSEFVVTWEKSNVQLSLESNIDEKKENLGDKINSEAEDLFPIISPDGQTLYFSKLNDSRNLGKGNNDDIWYSNLRSDSTWSAASHFGKDINNLNHNILATSLNGDTKFLVLNQYSGEGKEIKDEYLIYTKNGSTWSKPKKQKISGYKNESDFISACLAPDGEHLILSLKNKLSEGETDLFLCTLEGENKWSKPFPLGSLNTKGIETTPFISPDGTKLYFSSDGYPGYGGADIFVAKRMDRTWKKWSPALNLGSTINTSDWDAYFSISSLEDYAYVCSSDNTIGGVDIFRVKLPKKEDLGPVIKLMGYVYDTITGAPLRAKVTIRDFDEDSVITELWSDQETGYYEALVPQHMSFEVMGEKERYNADKQVVDAKNTRYYKEIQQDLYLKPYGPGVRITMNRIYFYQTKYVIRDRSLPEVDKLYKILSENPDIKIVIEGHSDASCERCVDLDLILSYRRARLIMNLMTEKGISPDRLRYIGYGQTRPKVKNASDTWHLNRRVEFLIMDNFEEFDKTFDSDWEKGAQ